MDHSWDECDKVGPAQLSLQCGDNLLIREHLGKLDHPPRDNSGTAGAVSTPVAWQPRSADHGAESAISCKIMRDDHIPMDAKLAVAA